jgi:hypothetical protein
MSDLESSTDRTLELLEQLAAAIARADALKAAVEAWDKYDRAWSALPEDHGYTHRMKARRLTAEARSASHAGERDRLRAQNEKLRAAVEVGMKLVTECEAEFTTDGMWEDSGQLVSLTTLTKFRRLTDEALKEDDK